jgi:hypothetical protein
MSDVKYLTARQVRERLGNVSDMSIWRWLHDPKMGFPTPLRINRRRLFNEEEIAEFEARHRVVGS